MSSNLVHAMPSLPGTTPEHRKHESMTPMWPPSPLAPIFYPRTVAVIGATEKPASVGRTVLRNLLEQPSGATIFPINPHRPNVLGIRCYPNIASTVSYTHLRAHETPEH